MAARSGVIVTSASAMSHGFGPGRDQAIEAGLLVEDDARDAEPGRERVGEVDLEPAREDDAVPAHGADLEARARQVEPDRQDSGLERRRRSAASAAGAAHEQRERGEHGCEAAPHVDLAITSTGSPTELKSNSHLASYCVTRTQPCEAA